MGCSLPSHKDATGLRGTNNRFQLGCLSIDRINGESVTGSFILEELKKSVDLGTPITIDRGLYATSSAIGTPCFLLEVAQVRRHRLLFKLRVLMGDLVPHRL